MIVVSPGRSLNSNIKFPVNISGQWHSSQDCQVSCPTLKNWLLNTGSLTERLQDHCHTFQLEVIGYQNESVSLADAEKIDCDSSIVIVREVILSGDDVPWVFAHTIMPQALFEDGVNDLANLQDKPLGSVIFNDPKFSRQPFELVALPVDNSLLSDLRIAISQPLWGRRSIFNYQEYKMMIAEVFLPFAPAYAGLSTW